MQLAYITSRPPEPGHPQQTGARRRQGIIGSHRQLRGILNAKASVGSLAGTTPKRPASRREPKPPAHEQDRAPRGTPSQVRRRARLFFLGGGLVSAPCCERGTWRQGLQLAWRTALGRCASHARLVMVLEDDRRDKDWLRVPGHARPTSAVASDRVDGRVGSRARSLVGHAAAAVPGI